MLLGCSVGDFDGNNDGAKEDFKDGDMEGSVDGITVGIDEGTAVGDLDGGFDGACLVGNRVGDSRKVDAACLFDKCASTRATKKLVGNEQKGGRRGRQVLLLSQFPEQHGSTSQDLKLKEQK